MWLLQAEHMFMCESEHPDLQTIYKKTDLEWQVLMNHQVTVAASEAKRH